MTETEDIRDMVAYEIEVEDHYGPTGVSHLGVNEMRTEVRMSETVSVELDPALYRSLPTHWEGMVCGYGFEARIADVYWKVGQIRAVYSIQVLL